MNRVAFTILLCLYISTLFAQGRRFLEPVFDLADVSPSVELARNYSVRLFYSGAGPSTYMQSLSAVLYTPRGDSETERPLIIYIHSGNFLPYPQNGACSGTIQDSSVVEIATRLAKMGYVVAVVNYRTGWNPLQTDIHKIKFSYINALYRAKQDISSFIRFFKKSVVELNNPFGINPNKITVWGEGTGGSTSLTSAFLNNINEFHPHYNPDKFKVPFSSGLVSIIDEKYNGNIHGDGPVTVVDEFYNNLTGLSVGDTLCIPNHSGYSSEFALVVNMGGSLADSSWLKKGEIPLISYHVPQAFFNSCYSHYVFHGPPNPIFIPVVIGTGSCDLAKLSDNFGNNQIFKSIPQGSDPYGDKNKSGHLGFYAFNNFQDYPFSPWEWAAADNPPSTCNKNAHQAKTYIDTIVGYFAPRACVALGLNCDFVASNKEISDASVNLKMAPNPAHSDINISVSAETPITNISVYDISGRMLRNISNINSSDYTLRRDHLQDGMYIVRIQFEKGLVSKKVVFN